MTPSRVIDYLELAAASERPAFIAAYPFRFLVGEDTLKRPARAQPTLSFKVPDFAEETTTTGFMHAAKRNPDTAKPVVLAVRKLQPTFPDMITVGRTANNDLVLPDESVSKFHAFFRMHGGILELSDAGSRNGTAVGELELERRGPAMPVNLGERVRLGSIELVLLDAGQLWDLARAQR